MDSQRVVIIGNSGAARECYWLLQDVIQANAGLRFQGFLSFEGFTGKLCELSHMELGNDDSYSPAINEIFIIGIGNPEVRRKAFDKWQGRGARFMNLIHPSVRLVGKVSMGEGNILAHHCHLSCNSAIGDANYLNGSVLIGHDAQIGNCNFLGTFTQILGAATLGSGNSLGVNSVVLPKARIGNCNTLAPGAYVYKGCGSGCLMAGNPALRIDE